MKRECLSLLAGLGALVLSICVLFLIHWLLVAYWKLESPDSAVFIALLVLPIIIYVLVSGRLTEFTGPGGWGAKFQTHARSTVDISTRLEDYQPLQSLDKGAARDLSALVADLDPELANALILRVGSGSHYALDVIRLYLRAMVSVGAPSYVVFESGSSQKFLGSASASQLLTYLEEQRTAREFMDKLRGQPRFFRGMGFLVTESLTSDSTNVMALQKFVATYADALVVTSPDGRKPIGIVNRDRLVAKLMLKLTGTE